VEANVRRQSIQRSEAVVVGNVRPQIFVQPETGLGVALQDRFCFCQIPRNTSPAICQHEHVSHLQALQNLFLCGVIVVPWQSLNLIKRLGDELEGFFFIIARHDGEETPHTNTHEEQRKHSQLSHCRISENCIGTERVCIFDWNTNSPFNFFDRREYFEKITK